jgi:hypothetical protein
LKQQKKGRLTNTLLAFVCAVGASECRFAKKYSNYDLLNSASARQQFLEDVMAWEGRFHQPGVGYNEATGITYDGTQMCGASRRIFETTESFSLTLCSLYLSWQ